MLAIRSKNQYHVKQIIVLSLIRFEVAVPASYNIYMQGSGMALFSALKARKALSISIITTGTILKAYYIPNLL